MDEGERRLCDTMRTILAIGVGSFIGGVSRYLLSVLIQAKAAALFPFGTLAVNIAGCLLIGVVFGCSEKGLVSSAGHLFLTTGVLGGFTTFSAFSVETFTLFKNGHPGYAIAYVFASVLLGLLATCAAYWAVKQC